MNDKTSVRCENCGSFLVLGYMSLVCPTCWRGKSLITEFVDKSLYAPIMSREPTKQEWEQWEVTKAKLEQIMNECREEGIDYHELLVEKDRDSLTIEEAELGAKLMSLFMDLTYPIPEDKIRAEIYQISQIFGIPSKEIIGVIDETEGFEGFVMSFDSVVTEEEIKSVLNECNLPITDARTKEECVRIVDALSEQNPLTAEQKKVLWHFACLITKLPHADEIK